MKSQHKRAFVLQFDNEIDLKAGKFEGRVEHVDSCRATHFHSPAELLEFLNQVLKEISTAEPQNLQGPCGGRYSEKK